MGIQQLQDLGGFAPRGVYLVLGGVCSGGVCSRGMSALGGCVPGPVGVCSGGCLLLGGCTWSWGRGVCSRGCQVLPPVNRMTNRCKNITLPQTSFAGGKYLDCRVIDRHIILKVKLLPPANIYGKVMFLETFVCPQGERGLCMGGLCPLGLCPGVT